MVCIVAGMILCSEVHFTRLLLTQNSTLASVVPPIPWTNFTNQIPSCQIFPGLRSSLTTIFSNTDDRPVTFPATYFRFLLRGIGIQDIFHLRLEADPCLHPNLKELHQITIFLSFYLCLDVLCTISKAPLIKPL